MFSRTSNLVSEWLLELHSIKLKPKEPISGPKLKTIVSAVKQAIEGWYKISLKDFSITQDDPGAKPLDYAQDHYDVFPELLGSDAVAADE